VLVREGDPHVELLGLERRRSRLQLKLDLLPAGEPVALWKRLTVDANEPTGE
jgi:hypothetical protein